MSLRHVLWKDLRREARGKEGVQAGLVLVALFFLVFLFALRDLSGAAATAAAVLWVPIVFAGAAVAGRALASEVDRGTLELLRSAPLPLVAHGISRTAIDLVLATLIALGTLALGALLFAIPVGAPLVALVLLSTVGIVVVGGLAGGVAAQARGRELLVPILMVPLLAPLLDAGLAGTIAALQGAGLDELRSSLLLLVGYDLVMAGLAWMLWPVILEAD